jgi:hypothetical protein
VKFYQDVWGVDFSLYTQGIQAGWTYIPSRGWVFATELPEWFTNMYGEAMPPADSCPIATGIFRMSGIWVWWIGLSPPPAGSPAAGASFKAIPPTKVCNNAQVTDLFPEYAETPTESVVDFTSTPEYIVAKEAEAARIAEANRIAAGGAPVYPVGSRIIENGQVKEMQADGTWKVIEAAPSASGGATTVTPIEQIDYGPLPPGSVPAQGVPVPPSWQQPVQTLTPITLPAPSGGGGRPDYTIEDENGNVVGSGQAETGFLSAGLGSGLTGLLILGAVVGLALKGNGKRKRTRR